MLKTLQSRFLAGVIIIIALFVSAIFFTFQRLHDDAMQQAQVKLTTMRDIKASIIEKHFADMGEQLRLLADSEQVIHTMAAMPASVDQLTTFEESTVNLKHFYEEQFYPTYVNAEAVTEKVIQADILANLIPQDHTAKVLQNLYLVNNQFPMGEKWRLLHAGDHSDYSDLHHDIHSALQNSASHLNFYDIFLVDTDGRIVYSVFKETDFGTSLVTGPWRDSNIGLLFNKLATNSQNFAPQDHHQRTQNTNSTAVVMQDYGEHGEHERVFYQDTSFYGPSYNQPAGFLGTAIYDEQQQLLGYLIAQHAQDVIERYMEHATGIGETTETIIISSEDFLLRSNSRFAESRALLIQSIDTEATRASAAGETGLKLITDYIGNDTLIAHRPLNIPDLNWSLNAKMNTMEFEDSLNGSRAAMLVMIVIAGLVSILITYLLLRSFKSRIHQVAKRANKIATGDLTDNHHQTAEDEFQVVEQSLIETHKSLQKVVAVAHNIAVGNVNQHLDKRSGNDTLVDAINHMAANAQDAANIADAVAAGNLQTNVKVRSEKDKLGLALKKMVSQLQHANATSEARNWIVRGIDQLNETVRGQWTLEQLANNVLNQVCTYLQVGMGALYLREDDKHGAIFVMRASYAQDPDAISLKQFRSGEALVGQAAENGRLIHMDKIPDHYPIIQSGLGAAPAKHIYLLPFKHNHEVMGVAEFATHEALNETDMRLLSLCEEIVAVAFHSAKARDELDDALSGSQALAEELQAQQEELQEANQQLEEQTQALEISQHEVEERNSRLLVAQSELNARAEQLTQSSKYKSEFLANMSHELRTPLNSILLLSKLIASSDNDDEAALKKNAKVIHDAGSDLLGLINEVLDLSKIEAGKMPLNFTDVDVAEFIHSFENLFRPQTDEKHLNFHITVADLLTPTITTDKDRVQQVVRNFLANAVKFTEQGDIDLRVHGVNKDIIDHLITTGPLYDNLNTAPENYLVISVKDSGIGVPEDRRLAVFEAFQQADGSTNRKYGGTGLGLSISSQIASALEGGVALQSTTTGSDTGSIFSVILPIAPSSELLQAHDESAEQSPRMQTTAKVSVELPLNQAQDEETQTPKNLPSVDDDRILLVIEDDQRFADALMDIGKSNGFTVVHAGNGTEGIRLAEHYLPAAILLDIQLPIMDGWGVLNHLKENPATRHIPVHVISVVDEQQMAYSMGAAQYLTKPVSQETLQSTFDDIENALHHSVKKLLIVEDHDIEREAIIEFIGGENDIACTGVDTGEAALKALREEQFDCFIVDLNLPDMDGYELLEVIAKDTTIPRTPVIVYTGQDLDRSQERRLRAYAESIVLKTADSSTRLLEESTLFLHRVQANLNSTKQEILQEVNNQRDLLTNKNILVVDDDIRNIFALSAVLEKHGINVIIAENGEEGLKQLAEHEHDIDLVLMDIMMPVMDGYAAMQAIRAQAQYADLPIIALTAKAMAKDRQQCLDAGASDYMAKPVDFKQLLSLIRVWLSQQKR